MIQSRLPAGIGLGFKPEHFDAISEKHPPLGFFEVHAENFMGDGGIPHLQLAWLREHYALSVHGVGLSIGGAGRLDGAHLARLKTLCDRYRPDSFSEHLAWSSHSDAFLNDLLPLPYNSETLEIVTDHIDEVQHVLGRQMLLENPSSYLAFEASSWSEPDFLREVAKRTGCGLLFDVNNVFVSASNLDTDPLSYVDAFPLDLVREIHLGGHAQEDIGTGLLLIDSHGAPVADPVWELYAETIARTGPLATLIEWDNDLPAFGVLEAEAYQAAGIMRAALKRNKEPSHAIAG